MRRYQEKNFIYHSIKAKRKAATGKPSFILVFPDHIILSVRVSHPSELKPKIEFYDRLPE